MSRTVKLSCTLKQTIQRVTDMGEDYVHHRKKLLHLLERLEEGRFHLAVLGQFKRGKSTLLNALLGEDILPVSVIPLTAIPTFIRYGASLKARVDFLDGRPPEEINIGKAQDITGFVSKFVTETGNPKNRHRVKQVDVFHPSHLFREGIVLIDTPGIGSTHRHNTETALNFLPQCDAALFLVSGDLPVTEVEIEFLAQVRTRMRRLFFVMNKIDLLSCEEREESVDFLKKVLNEQGGIKSVDPLFCVSALMGCKARKTKDKKLWEKSGLREVETYLVEFLAREKTRVLTEALSHKALDTIEDTLMQIRLAIRSLHMPVEDLKRRLDVLNQKFSEAERNKNALSISLEVERARIQSFLEEQCEVMRQDARSYLTEVIKGALATADQTFNIEDEVSDAMEEKVPEFFERRLGRVTSAVEKKVHEALLPYKKQVDEILEAVQRTAADIFSISYHATDAGEVFETIHRPYWTTQEWAASASPLPQGIIDKILPARIRRSRITRRFMDQVESLAISNVENLRWAISLSLDEAFRHFQSELDDNVIALIDAIRRTIHTALNRQKERTRAIEAKVTRLEAAEQELARIKGMIEI